MIAPPPHAEPAPAAGSPAPAAAEDDSASSAVAARYYTETEAWQHSLVPLAMGLPCWIVPADGAHELRVAPEALACVRHQLECFDRESLVWPPRAPDLAPAPAAPPRPGVPLSPLLWVLALFGAFHAQTARPALVDVGLLDATRLLDHGEWWRAATALWLHADLGHLVSNAGAGFLVFSALVATFRAWPAWSLLAVASVLGNLAAALLHHGEPYRSLGASTAVFAGLGLLTGRAVRRLAHSPRALALPLLSGLVVLGLFGAGGVNIDVIAHATGFGAGLLLGLLAARGGAPASR